MCSCSEVLRTKSSRQEVTIEKIMVANRQQALNALIHKDPQMVM
jgi:hypothetical protein